MRKKDRYALTAGNGLAVKSMRGEEKRAKPEQSGELRVLLQVLRERGEAGQ